MSQQQIRDRLQASGYDPKLADPFFSSASPATPSTAAAAGVSTGDFAKALQSLGLLDVPASGAADRAEETTRSSADRRSGRAGGLFGKDIFNRASTVFDPVTSGPVDPGYRLGIGDGLQIVITGQVELALGPEIRRDGTIVIPNVGQIPLAGLTLDAARTLLKERMGRSYSGLNTGEARLDLSISRLRTNAVTVIGEVEDPGAYQVNALSTVYHALAKAGGPSDRGSFRNVELRRGNRIIQRLDLYEYLLNGNATGDVRLEQGDVVFVPLNTRVVAMTGAVRRPRVFELNPNEGFDELLRFAGGLLATASVDRVQIDRIVPPEQRRPGFDRVKVDVELRGSLDSLKRVRLNDGDIVQVFNVGDVRRNTVALTGQVFQPGEYELRPGMTLGDLITEAQGALPWALSDRVKIVRQLPLTGHSELLSVDATSATGKKFVLTEFDAVTVLDGRTAYPGGQVTIEGAVHSSGQRPFVENESLRDAIERSGGFTEEAQYVDVYRRKVGSSYSDSTTATFKFVIGSGFRTDRAPGEFMLQRDDRIVVRSSPGYRHQVFVGVSGGFQYPGPYAITENVDRVRDVVQRAGGALPGGYAQSFKLQREGKIVDVSYDRAMRGDVDHNILLRGGDAISIGPDPRTVFVTGAVARPSLVRYRPGFSIQDYIELSGGPTDRGEPLRAVIDYPTGYSKRVKRVALVFHSSPDVVSGAVITVPERPTEQKTSAGELWTRIFQASAALASIVVAYAAVTK